MPGPVISILMGSSSDAPIIKEAIVILEEFKIPHEVLILSAHRSPVETSKYAKDALSKGIKVIIAAAGGAAHLAGVIAAYFPLPVIGIPVMTKTLGGVDSLYSIVQMPPGVPVATVGIDAAKNAALLALQILAIRDLVLQKKLIRYKNTLAQSVNSKNEVLQSVGLTAYLTKISTKP